LALKKEETDHFHSEGDLLLVYWKYIPFLISFTITFTIKKRKRRGYKPRNIGSFRKTEGKKLDSQLSMLLHACNPSTWEAEVGGMLLQGQPWLHSEALSQLPPPKKRKEIDSSLELPDRDIAQLIPASAL
jgi:hypothetical protein